jgi:hypothetical protein
MKVWYLDYTVSIWLLIYNNSFRFHIYHPTCIILAQCTVKPVYKGHYREPENVAFIYRLKLYALLINGKNSFSLWCLMPLSTKTEVLNTIN